MIVAVRFIIFVLMISAAHACDDHEAISPLRSDSYLVELILGGKRDLTLPDPVLTPGAVTSLTTEEVCTRKWGKDARAVTPAMKAEVFASYGLSGNKRTPECRGDAHGRIFEIDHLVSRELGGADEVKNLWPQCYSGPWNAVAKDRTENRLHREVCAGKLTLQQAQQEIAKDWRVPYRRYFGE